MKKLSSKFGVLVAICAVALASSLYAGKIPNAKEVGTNPAVHGVDADAMRVQGEQRFRANCGRCHAAPQRFPPRMMATVLRHMRVRATITDEDMRLVLFYMTQ
jgi:mono/diheme cytochrome c family protein